MAETIREVIEIVTRNTERLDQLIRQNQQLAESVDQANASTNRGRDALRS